MLNSFLEKLKEQLFYYHNATDVPLELFGADGRSLAGYSGEYRYCEMVREACGERKFCDRMHMEAARLSAELGEGYIFSCPAGLVHFQIAVKGKDGEDYYILAGPLAMDYPDISVVDALIQGYDLPMDIRRRLFGALNGIPVIEPVRIQHLCRLLFSLADNFAKAYEEPEAGSDRAMPDEFLDPSVSIPIIRKAVAFIDAHYQENLRLDMVAAHVGLNPAYFSTIFKKELCISFSNYLTQKRIEAACRLLQNSNHSLSDIAAEAGFENQSYFSQVFKNHTGMTPTEYRRKGLPGKDTKTSP